MPENNKSQESGLVFNIQRWSLHDGPGIRTVVFLKGCPMRCVWCCNPESSETYNELVFFSDKCIGCKSCISCCVHGAISEGAEKLAINREICAATCYKEKLNVFPCAKQCYGKALAPAAELKTVDAVMNEVMKDELIYKQSKIGGLTLSGGEPLLQHRFSYALLERAKYFAITTALETCGIASRDAFEKLLQFVDYLFFDIKFGDPQKHKAYTGVGNEQILENAVKASWFMHEKGSAHTIRIPVVPTISDMDDFKLILDFVKEKLAPDAGVEIMPYHRLGRGKYATLGMQYDLIDLEPCNEQDVTEYEKLLHLYDFNAK